MGSLLHAIELPDEGDTLFTNMTAVYEALPDALRSRIEHLGVEHNYEARNLAQSAASRIERSPALAGAAGDPSGRARASGHQAQGTVRE